LRPPVVRLDNTAHPSYRGQALPFDAPSVRAVGDLAGGAEADAVLADEVAVDFPSVRPLVDRMRSAFLGDEELSADPLSAELHLTAEQASRGGRVPVDVPVRRVCRRCGGRGEVWSDSCPACGGQGDGVRLHTVDVHVPSGVRHGAWLAFTVGLPQEPATRVHLRVTIG
jgi:hypothetical protein